MAVSQARSKRKETGARYVAHKKQRLHQLGGLPALTKLGTRKLKQVRILGGNKSEFLLLEESVNVLDKKTKKTKKVQIKAVLKNPANRHFVRRNILTKGTIIDTELGQAEITSRPGQVGTINAVLV